MQIKYSDIFHQNVYFQRAVNLSLDAGKIDFVDHYIPTKTSVMVLKQYLKAAIRPTKERASVLIGPYGKGKSHTIFMALSILSEDDIIAEHSFSVLADRIENIDAETAKIIRSIRKDNIRLLPVIINNRYLNIRQAFLASLKRALSDRKISEVLPNNYYTECTKNIQNWKTNYHDTYVAYKIFLRKNGVNHSEFESRLSQFDSDALELFQKCYRTILPGAEFDPLLESDVNSLYESVSLELKKRGLYDGIFVVFDEFGKYLSVASERMNNPDFSVLQDFAEMASRSEESAILLTCISHKAISSYAEYKSDTQVQSFRTVEGRFSPIYFTSTFEGNFSLISGALGRDAKVYKSFTEQHISERHATIEECINLKCFTGYESSVEEIVDQCFPMHPITALSLIKLSERVAQNERTIFTYLADTDSPLADLIQKNNGEYVLDTIEPIYDWFHSVIRENREDEELREIIIFTDALLPMLSYDEKKLIKAIVLFNIITDPCLNASRDILKSSLQWSDDLYDTTVRNLEKTHRIYTRKSDGVLCLMHTAAESIRRDIDEEIKLRRDRHVDIASQLSELRPAGYTIPRRYNDRFSMIRWFNNVYISTESFYKQSDSSFLKDAGQADGYVLYLLGDAQPEDVQQHLEEWDDNSVIVLVPKYRMNITSAIEECAAIRKLQSYEQDETIRNELSFYFDDMYMVVNKGITHLFDDQPYCVTIDRIVVCPNAGTEVSRICEEILFPDTPVINHEMINRNVISKQMYNARQNVINTLLSEQKWQEVYDSKKAEYPIFKAILGHVDDERMVKVLDKISFFVSTCEQTRQRVSNLYDQLISSPYGLRRGVIPILLAYVLRDDKEYVTIFNHNQELPFDGATLGTFDQHVEDYELLVDRGNPEQAAYLHMLHNQWTPNEHNMSIKNIHDTMSQIVRSLPRSARAGKMMLKIEKEHVLCLPMDNQLVDLRTTLVQFNSNSRDILLNKIPHILNKVPSESCAMMLIECMHKLQKYTKNLSDAIEKLIILRLGNNENQSIRGALTLWLQGIPASKLQQIHSQSLAGLLNVAECTDNHTDSEWTNMCATALTGLPIEDWSDAQIQNIDDSLTQVLQELEKAEETQTNTIEGNAIQISLGNMKVSQQLEDRPLDGLSELLYHSMKSSIEEYGDALTINDKVLVLANLILNLNT